MRFLFIWVKSYIKRNVTKGKEFSMTIQHHDGVMFSSSRAAWLAAEWRCVCPLQLGLDRIERQYSKHNKLSQNRHIQSSLQSTEALNVDQKMQVKSIVPEIIEIVKWMNEWSVFPTAHKSGVQSSKSTAYLAIIKSYLCNYFFVCLYVVICTG